MENKVRILCLDGGGIRGIIPASVLEYVEKKLAEFSNNPNARIADYFDMIVGTSTGGILGCFYLMPNPKRFEPGNSSSKYPASEALKLYSEKGEAIFNQSKKNDWFGLRQLLNATQFKPENIESIFKDKFGDIMFDQLLGRLIITTYDMQSQKSFFFNSREEEKHREDRKFMVRDVARSTSAAPTYFPPAIIRNFGNNSQMVNIDGGVFANNPTMCAYAEARTTNFENIGINRPSAKDMLILSIGTGSQKMDLKNFQRAGNWGALNWAKTIPDIMMDGGLDTVTYQVGLLFDTLDGENKKNYKRVDVPKHLRSLEGNGKPLYNSDMADASKENIRNLLIAGQETIKEANIQKDNEHSLDEFIKKLIEVKPISLNNNPI
ncbi:MAG: patatin-like phospholipase family protein [Bacteroidetes bacterium]|nr:patatin-like phospholipase family protein [Bacteroidota bacterium]